MRIDPTQEISKSVPEEKDVDEYATATAMARDQNQKVHSLIFWFIVPRIEKHSILPIKTVAPHETGEQNVNATEKTQFQFT